MPETLTLEQVEALVASTPKSGKSMEQLIKEAKAKNKSKGVDNVRVQGK
jgi:hypothetical protein